jgi:hypothetical protein
VPNPPEHALVRSGMKILNDPIYGFITVPHPLVLR